MSSSLQRLLNEANIRHFSIAGDHRILSPIERGGRGIVLPDEGLWPNIIPTLQLADVIRVLFGGPLRVVSGYRTPDYNALVGGGRASEHVQFRALDLTPSSGDPSDLIELKKIATEVMEHAHADGQRTGLGIYKTFVHIDTGSVKARRRRWYGKGAK